MTSDVVYASRLARLSVLSPDGGGVGIVGDVVIGPPLPGANPPVYGLMVTVPGRHIFLGAGRIAGIDSEGVHLRSGALNLRRFARRPNETLVLADLIDRRVPGDGEARVNDVGIGHSGRRATAWEVTSVDVLTGGRLGRRGRHHRSEPGVLRPLLADHDSHHQLREMHPADAAELLVTLTVAQRRAAALALDDEQLADLIQELPHDSQARLLIDLGVERASDVLEVMEPDDAADVLGDLEPAGRASLLGAMDSDDAELLRRLLVYGEDTAGGLMHPEPIACSPDTTVAEALARLRNPDIVPAMAAQVFVVEPPAQTPTGSYLGVCGIQHLLREPPARRLRSCIDPGPEPLEPTLPVARVAQHLAAYNLVAAPAVDDDGRLIGVVTVDDVLDHVLPDDWRRR